MKLHAKSQWNQIQIEDFLASVNIPMRLAFLDKHNEPMVCSLWFMFDGKTLWSASHKNAYVIRCLKQIKKVSFEVSTNDYPYKGVRGKAEVKLSTDNASYVLNQLIEKYLADGNEALASWLMSRADNEYILKITPLTMNAWDFSDRMQK